jgi:hypothetical protein
MHALLLKSCTRGFTTLAAVSSTGKSKSVSTSTFCLSISPIVSRVVWYNFGTTNK